MVIIKNSSVQRSFLQIALMVSSIALAGDFHGYATKSNSTVVILMHSMFLCFKHFGHAWSLFCGFGDWEILDYLVVPV